MSIFYYENTRRIKHRGAHLNVILAIYIQNIVNIILMKNKPEILLSRCKTNQDGSFYFFVIELEVTDKVI